MTDPTKVRENRASNAPKRPAKRRKASAEKPTTWDVVVSKGWGRQLMPHGENRICGDKKCCRWALLREVLPRPRAGRKKAQ